MGNTIISSLLFQPPTPANELDYFGNPVAITATTPQSQQSSSENNSTKSSHNDPSYQTGNKSKGRSVRGGGSAKHHSGSSSGSSSASRQQQQQQSSSSVMQPNIKKHQHVAVHRTWEQSHQQQQVVQVNTTEPTLHYIWLLSASHPIPIPALHIRHDYTTTSRSASSSSSSRYTLLYSHGNAEDIGLLAKFLTDIAKLLQVDILVYDYSGYGVSVDRSAVLRFYATWGARLDDWKRWRRENKLSGGIVGGSGGGGEGMRMESTENKSGSSSNGKKMVYNEGGVCYSMDVFMAPMVFPKSTRTIVAAAGKKGTTTSSASSSSSATAGGGATSSSSTKLNLPDNVYVCGDELDFIEDDATTVATSPEHSPRPPRGRTRTSSSGGEARDTTSLLDIDDNEEDEYCSYDEDYYDNDGTTSTMPSLAATCYDNSTITGATGDDYYYEDEEDEVSLFTCGANSCNDGREQVEEEDVVVDDGGGNVDMMRDDSSSNRHGSYHRSASVPPSSPRSVISGASTTLSASSRSHHHIRRRRRNSKTPLKLPLTPKQKRRALLHKYKWTTPSPSEEQCYGDIWLAYTYLLQIREIPSKHVLLYGKSVGSGPTCWLAQRTCCQSVGMGGGSRSRCNSNDRGLEGGGGGGGMMYEDVRDDGNVDYRDERVGGGSSSGRSKSSRSNSGDAIAPGGVILHSPFLSVIRVVLDMGFTTVGDLFPNIDRVKDISCPTYIIHGTEDEIVPYYHGEGLFNALPDTSKAVPFWANGAGHNNIEMEMPTAYIKRLMQFIRQCDRVNYPAGGELLRTRARAFSSGSHGSSTSKRGSSSSSSSEQEMMMDSATVLNHANRSSKYTRQMSMPNMPASSTKQRKKKGALVRASSTAMETSSTKSKRRQGRSHRKSNSIDKQQQQKMSKYHYQSQQQQQHRSVRDQYPSVETNLSTDAAMCGIQPPEESKYHTSYSHQQQPRLV